MLQTRTSIFHQSKILSIIHLLFLIYNLHFSSSTWLHIRYTYAFHIQTFNQLSHRAYTSCYPTSSSRFSSNDKSYEYYKKYSKDSHLSQKFHDSGGILYRTSILTPSEFQVIQEELLSSSSAKGKGRGKGDSGGKKGSLGLTLNKETSSSVAINRVGASLPWDCETVKMLQDPNGSISRLVNNIVGCDTDNKSSMVLAQNVPVEVRTLSLTLYFVTV